MSRPVKVFISSTFKDMNAERDVLIRRVFPRLREKADEIGIRVREIDLRWGVTEEEAVAGSVEELCLSGIEECRPYFLCLLGARYGWIPPLSSISLAEYDEIQSSSVLSDVEKKTVSERYFRQLDDDRVYGLDAGLDDSARESLRSILEKAGIEGAGQSITHKEIGYAGLWDEPPLFIRDLDDRLSTLEAADKPSEEEEKILRTLYVRRTGEPVWSLRDRPNPSEKSSVIPVLKKIGLSTGMHRFFYFRNDSAKDFYSGGDRESVRSYTERSTESVAKLRCLKKEIRNKQNWIACADYACSWNPGHAGKEDEGAYPVEGLEAFEETVFNDLWNHIRTNPELRSRIEKDVDALELEKEHHLRFVDSRTYNFHGRHDLLRKVMAAVDDALQGRLEKNGIATQTVMVTGRPGSGKSALLAKLYLEYGRSRPDCLIVPWFVGASTQSSYPYHLLKHVCGLMVREFGLTEDVFDDEGRVSGTRQATIPSDIGGMSVFLKESLQKSGRSVVVVIDALDQLVRSAVGRVMAWLPEDLPRNCCVVTSLAEESNLGTRFVDRNAAALLAEMRNRSVRPYEIPLEKLSQDEIHEICRAFLRLYNKRLSSRHLELLAGKEEAHNPLYLQVALEELRILPRHEDLEQFIEKKLDGTTREVFERMLCRVEFDFERRFGKAVLSGLFRDFVKLIACGRDGMSEFDVRVLLSDWRKIEGGSAYEKTQDDAESLRLNDFYWGELRLSLRGYLIQRGPSLDFFHKQLKEAVVARYLSTSESRRETHAAIAGLFTLMGYRHPASSRDLPHHILRSIEGDGAGEWRRLQRVLCDLLFLQTKSAAGFFDDLLNDFNESLERYPDIAERRMLEKYRRVLNIASHRIRIRPALCFQEMYNALQWCADDERGDIESCRKRFLDEGNVFLHQLRKPETVKSRLVMTFATGSDVYSAGFFYFCEFSPDGRTLLSGGEGNTLKAWDASTGQGLWTLAGHAREVCGCGLSPDGKTIVSGSRDDTLRLWEAETGKELAVLRNDVIAKGAVFVAGGKRIWIIDERTNACKVLDSATGAESASYALPQDDELASWAVSEDRTMLCIGTFRSELRLFDLESGTPMRRYGLAGNILSCAISPDRTKLLAANQVGNELYLIDAETGNVLWKQFNPNVRKCAFSRDGTRIILSQGARLVVCDCESGKEIESLDGHKDQIRLFAVSPDGNTIASISESKVVCLWDLMNENELQRLNGDARGIQSMTFTPNGKKVFATGDENYTSYKAYWDVSTGKELVKCSSSKHRYSITHCMFTRDGGRIALVVDEKLGWRRAPYNCLKILDAETLRELKTIKSPHSHGRVICHSLSPDRRMFFSVADPRNRYQSDADSIKTLVLWDVEKRKRLKKASVDWRYLVEPVFSPDGSKIVCTSPLDKTVRLWCPVKKDAQRTLVGHRSQVESSVFSPDGRRILSASIDGVVKSWHSGNGREIRDVTTKGGVIRTCGFSPDGRRIFTESFDRIRMWNARTGAELSGYEHFALEGRRCTFSPDGTMVIAAGKMSPLSLLSCSTGKALGEFVFDSGLRIHCVSGDGTTAACADQEGGFYLFRFRGVRYGPPVVTAIRHWNGRKWDNRITAACPLCGTRFEVANRILDAITDLSRNCQIGSDDSACEKLPDEAWDEPSLASPCPSCRGQLRFNPFAVDDRDR